MDLAPGVYLNESPRGPAPELGTGVPAFLSIDRSRSGDRPRATSAPRGVEVARLDRWSAEAGAKLRGYLHFAVRGFFANGGRRCYVISTPSLSPGSAVEALLQHLDDVDLLCAPGLGVSAATSLVGLCAALGRTFAVLDSPRLSLGGPTGIEAYRAQLAKALSSLPAPYDAALYFPWIQVRGVCPACGGSGLSGDVECAQCAGSGVGSATGLVPPSGHVAGIYSRTDRTDGVFKAPANVEVAETFALQVDVPAALQGRLNEQGVNCLRVFPGRGIRVWGARTLGTGEDYRWVNQRRLVLTLCRSLRQAMSALVFEPNDPLLWVRSSTQATSVLRALFARGAFAGATEAGAFYVKCDEETNPPEVRAAGQVVTEIGLLAPAPAEVLKIQIIQGERGVTITEQAL